jgi:hypothetical protein
MSSAYHPQSDGQSEVVNKVIMMYLRCLTGDNPKEWLQWLSWAKFCYNTSYHQSINTTPFKLVYGRDPPLMKTYSPGDAATPSVDKLLAECDDFLSTQKFASFNLRITTRSTTTESAPTDHSRLVTGFISS